MATFQKRGNRWRAIVKKNRPKPISKTFATKGQAVAWAADMERMVGHGRTWGDALRRYRDEDSPTKRGGRKEILRIDRWLQDWAAVDLPIEELSARHLAAWRDQRLQQVSPSSVRREMTTMGHVLTMARKEWEWIAVSPMESVRRPAEHKERSRTISDEETQLLCHVLGYAADEPLRTQNQQVAWALLFALETAMRSGEILAMRWAHVFERHVHVPYTKTDAARDVPLSTRALGLLEQAQGLDAVTVLTISDGNRDALWRKAVRRAGIEDLHFHDSRRTATSRLAKKVDVLTLGKITGHKDINLLHRVYYSVQMSDVAMLLD